MKSKTYIKEAVVFSCCCCSVAKSCPTLCDGYFHHFAPEGNLSISPINISVQFSAVQLVMSDSLQPHGLKHTRLPCPSPTPRAYSNLCPLSQWCHPTTSSSATPFSFCLQSFPASGCFSSELTLHIRWQKYWNFSFLFFLPIWFYCVYVKTFAIMLYGNFSSADLNSCQTYQRALWNDKLKHGSCLHTVNENKIVLMWQNMLHSSLRYTLILHLKKLRYLHLSFILCRGLLRKAMDNKVAKKG